MGSVAHGLRTRARTVVLDLVLKLRVHSACSRGSFREDVERTRFGEKVGDSESGSGIWKGAVGSQYGKPAAGVSVPVSRCARGDHSKSSVLRG